MKKLILMTMVVLIMTNSSSALAKKTCNCGAQGQETDCCWEISEGKLIISAAEGKSDVDMKFYEDEEKTTSPWFNYRNSITSIKIEKGISTIGGRSFEGLFRVASVDISDSVKNIEIGAFFTNALTSVVIPDSVTSVGFAAFYGNQLTSINIPDSLNDTGWWVLGSNPNLKEIIVPDSLKSSDVEGWEPRFFFGSNIQTIRCLGDTVKCQKALARFLPPSLGGKCSSNCLNSSIKILSADNPKYCIGKYKWIAGACKIACEAGYKDMGGFCNRVRYTPAEAAAATFDDNTNVITITFKL